MLVLLAAACVDGTRSDDEIAFRLEPLPNQHGVAESAHVSGEIDRDSAFFQPLGALPGRTCETCHTAHSGWGLTPDEARAVFDASDGLAPLFAIHDVGSRIDADLSTTQLRRQAFKTLLKRGLARFAVCTEDSTFPVCVTNIPPSAEFTVTHVDDPTGFSTPDTFNVFRRIIPTANFAVSSTISWSGLLPAVPEVAAGFSDGAVQLHEFGAPTGDQIAELAEFQTGHFFAQTVNTNAGALDADGALGGPEALMNQLFYFGINDFAGLDPSGAPHDPNVFDLYSAWEGLGGPGASQQDKARGRIADGQAIFNTRQFEISGVAGFNDVYGAPTIVGTCGSCHTAPNVGSNSSLMFMNIGTADADRVWDELPLLTVTNDATGETIEVGDLGHAAETGLWADIGKFKVPQLRGLSPRAPYFHDGSARDIKPAIAYHDQRFDIGLSSSERNALAHFLRAL